MLIQIQSFCFYYSLFIASSFGSQEPQSTLTPQLEKGICQPNTPRVFQYSKYRYFATGSDFKLICPSPRESLSAAVEEMSRIETRSSKRLKKEHDSNGFGDDIRGSSMEGGLPLKKQQTEPTSQDSEDTLPYSLSPIDYGRKDFESDSDSDLSDGVTLEEESSDDDTSSGVLELSGSTLDEDKASSRPSRQVATSSKGAHRTLRQTTLNFAKPVKNVVLRSTFKYSDLDTHQYRKGYPGTIDDPKLRKNLQFYNMEIRSEPNGGYIDHIHKNWFGNYELLERHHGYIQWLFPIRERGMNWDAQELQLHEAEAIKNSKAMSARVLSSYKLMLDFYGMKLVDEKTGKIVRSDRWKRQFDNLKWSTHNYLRITRILKSLGELGYEHLKKPFLEFVLHEALEERTLERLLRSCRDYWIGTIKDDNDRAALHQFIDDRSKKF